MTDELYVATDARGVGRTGDVEVLWHLPGPDGTPGEATTAASLVLRDASALLDELGERIFVAEPWPEATGTARAPLTGAGVLTVGSARLLAETSWCVERAARLALDCAEHVLGDAASAVLPGGTTLAGVIAEARSVVERSSEDAEQRLGVLARLAAARRLRRRGELLGDIAIEALQDDLEAALDALDDPDWATLATARDAVLAAVEAVRHLALPRYIAAREHVYAGDADGEDEARRPGRMIVTPWGPITFGAEHQSGYAPSWVAARDAALRARDAVRGRDGEDAAVTERSWQAERLADLLAPAPD